MDQRNLLALGAVLVLASAAYYIFFMGSNSDEETGTLTVTSTAFEDGEAIPVLHTRDGSNLSPQIAWSAVPEGTRSIALTCVDVDAPGGSFTHWVVFNIPSGQTELSENTPTFPILENMVRNGVNDYRGVGYDGPSPPSGETHRYVFTVYALDTLLDLETGATRMDLLAAMAGHDLARGTLTGTYTR
jgi:Raf kinase inhibitor-like YbhB/YbcL family protein